MKISKFAIWTVLLAVGFFVTANAQITDISVNDGTIDRSFDPNRSLYYITPVNAQNGIPKITVNGGTIVAEAADFEAHNVTLVSDNETNKQYRFVYLKPKNFVMEHCSVDTSGLLTVKGNFNKEACMTILKPIVAKGGEAYKLSDISKDEPEKYIFDVVDVTEQNEFTYIFPVAADSGTYRIIISYGNVAGGAQGETSIYYANQSDIIDCLYELNNSIKTPSELKSFILENYKLINMDKDLYLSIKDYSVFDSMLIGKNFQEMDGVITAINEAMAVSLLNQEDKKLPVIEKYKTILDLDFNGNYSKLINKGALENILSGRTYQSAAEVKIAFEASVAVQYINEAAPSEAKKRLEDSFDMLGVNTSIKSEYTNLTSEEKYIVVHNVMNKNFNNESLVISAIENALESIKASKVGTNDTAGYEKKPRSTGGDGAFTSSYAPVSIVKEPDSEIPTNVINKEEAFIDLDDAEWAKPAVLMLYDWGVVKGRQEKIFAPNDYVTREEFIKMIVLATGLIGEKTEVEFSDINENDWFYEPVSIAVGKGIIKGVGDNFFGTGQKLTRQDMAVVVNECAKAAGIKISGTNKAVFTDKDEIADYAKTAVTALSAGGIINGVGDSKMAPNGYVTRAMAAKIIYNLVKNL